MVGCIWQIFKFCKMELHPFCNEPFNWYHKLLIMESYIEIYMNQCFCCYVIKSAGEVANKVGPIVIRRLKSTANRNKSLSNQDIGKYVRCTCTFYFYLEIISPKIMVSLLHPAVLGFGIGQIANRRRYSLLDPI